MTLYFYIMSNIQMQLMRANKIVSENSGIEIKKENTGIMVNVSQQQQ